MTLVTRTFFTAALALSSGVLLLGQHGGGAYGAGAGARAAAAGGYGGQAFAAPPIGTLNSPPPGSSRAFRAPSIGTINAVPPGRARLGYAPGNAYGRYGHNNGYGRNKYRGYPFVYWLTPYYYPGLFYDTGAYYDSYDAYPPYDTSGGPQYQPEELAQSAPPYAPYPNYYAAPNPYLPPSYYNPPPASPTPVNPTPADAQSAQTPPSPPVTLVLRTGEKFQVQNYAVMGQTFWDFSRQPVRKIPVSSIDVPASAKATEASGADFPRISGS